MMKRRILLLVLAAVCLITLAGCACGHEWAEANCETPKTCSLCGETEGAALGHSWQDAACEAPKTCGRCARTEGTALGHTPGEWQRVGMDFLSLTATDEQACTVCGVILDSTSEPITALYQNRNFLFTAVEFTERLNLIYENLGKTDMRAELITGEDGALSCAVYRSEARFADLSFYALDGVMDSTRVEQRSIAQVVATFEQRSLDSLDNEGGLAAVLGEPTDPQVFTDVMVPLSMACNPALDEASAQSLVTLICDGLTNSQAGSLMSYTYEQEDLTYFITDSLLNKLFGILPTAEQ